MGLNRRNILAGIAGGFAAGALDSAATATNLLETAQLRGSFSAADQGLLPRPYDDQSKLLQSILERASAENKPVFLPPGNYVISNIKLPSRTRLMGVPGATRLVYSGAGHCLLGENCERIELTGLVIDGINRSIEDYAEGLVRITNTKHLVIDNCEIIGSSGIGIYAGRSTGRIERNLISGASGACAIYAIENSNLLINANRIHDCANGGILVHRWTPGEDSSIVTNNTISNIAAKGGGTGQRGNGINIYRAHSVQVANNNISNCEFSAIRANGGSNVQILSNNCRNSGETAIYSEFEFEGALISNNIVDTCARGISIVNYLQGGRLAVCSNNLVRNAVLPIAYEDENATTSGISVEADTTVTGNVIENVKDFGLALGYGPYLRNVVVSANMVRKSGTGIYVSVVEGCESTLIADNVISDFKKGAIVGYHWEDAVTGELDGKPKPFNHLTLKGNLVS